MTTSELVFDLNATLKRLEEAWKPGRSGREVAETLTAVQERLMRTVWVVETYGVEP